MPLAAGTFGKRQYVARCAGCHGENGLGGGHGPGIAGARHTRADSAAAVRTVILEGIRGRGMPAFTIPMKEAGAIAAYVMSLKAPARALRQTAPGDPEAGRAQYNSGGCSNCHMMGGTGGVLGPDLSHIGRDGQPAQTRCAKLSLELPNLDCFAVADWKTNYHMVLTPEQVSAVGTFLGAKRLSTRPAPSIRTEVDRSGPLNSRLNFRRDFIPIPLSMIFRG